MGSSSSRAARCRSASAARWPSRTRADSDRCATALLSSPGVQTPDGHERGWIPLVELVGVRRCGHREPADQRAPDTGPLIPFHRREGHGGRPERLQGVRPKDGVAVGAVPLVNLFRVVCWRDRVPDVVARSEDDLGSLVAGLTEHDRHVREGTRLQSETCPARLGRGARDHAAAAALVNGSGEEASRGRRAQMVADGARGGGLPCDRHPSRIPPKVTDVRLHPPERRLLVEHSVVAGWIGVLTRERRKREEAHSTEPVIQGDEDHVAGRHELPRIHIAAGASPKRPPP